MYSDIDTLFSCHNLYIKVIIYLIIYNKLNAHTINIFCHNEYRRIPVSIHIHLHVYRAVCMKFISSKNHACYRYPQHCYFSFDTIFVINCRIKCRIILFGCQLDYLYRFVFFAVHTVVKAIYCINMNFVEKKIIIQFCCISELTVT